MYDYYSKVGGAVQSPPAANPALKFFNLIPEQLRAQTVIAGGAAVDFEKAGDVDLWILNVGQATNSDMPDIRELLRKHLYAMFAGNDIDPFSFPQGDFHEHPGPLSANPSDDESVAGDARKSYSMFSGEFEGKKFQILCTDAIDAHALLTQFDLSVHQVGLDTSGRRITNRTTTAPGERIHITNMHSPERIFKRLRKLMSRYNSFCSPIDLQNLAEAPDERTNVLREIRK